MINPKFIKCVTEHILKYSKKSNSEVIFKKGKMIFSQNDKGAVAICWGWREKHPNLV